MVPQNSQNIPDDSGVIFCKCPDCKTPTAQTVKTAGQKKKLSCTECGKIYDNPHFITDSDGVKDNLNNASTKKTTRGRTGIQKEAGEHVQLAQELKKEGYYQEASVAVQQALDILADAWVDTGAVYNLAKALEKEITAYINPIEAKADAPNGESLIAAGESTECPPAEVAADNKEGSISANLHPSSIFEARWFYPAIVAVLVIAIAGLGIWYFSSFSDELMSPEGRRKGGSALVIPVIGPIDGYMYEIVRRGIEQARHENVRNVILVIDTNGGMIDESKRIVAEFDRLDANTNLIAYIRPDEFGGAISAGAFISFACHEIFMHPSAMIGGSQSVIGMMSARDVYQELGLAWAKKESINMAIFRARPQRIGHPYPVMEAMALEDMVLWVKEDNGDAEFATGTTKPSGEGWEKIKDRGQILSRTAVEMERYGIANIVESASDVGKKLRLDQPDIYSESFFRSTQREMRERAESLKKAEKRFTNKWEELTGMLFRLDVTYNLEQPAETAREHEERLRRDIRQIRRVHTLCEDLISITEEYPDLGIPPEISQDLKRLKIVFEIILDGS